MLPKGFVVRSTASLAIFFCRTAYIATRIRPTIRTKPAIAIPIIAPLPIEDLLLLGPEVDNWRFKMHQIKDSTNLCSELFTYLESMGLLGSCMVQTHLGL